MRRRERRASDRRMTFASATGSVGRCVLILRMVICHVIVHIQTRDGQPTSGLGCDERPPHRARPSRARINRREVTEALNDAERIETLELRGAITYHAVLGRTAMGRLLVVAWIDHPDRRFPVHARQAGRRAARRYYR